MKMLHYLKTKVWYLVFDFLIFLILALLFYTLSVSVAAIVFFGTLCVFCLLIPLILEYRKKKKFFADLMLTAEKLENKSYLSETAEAPGDHEQELYLEIIGILNRDALEKLNASEQSRKEYREYIEMWVHEVKSPIAAARLSLESREDFDGKDGPEADLLRIEDYIEQALFYARSDTVGQDYMIRPVNLKKTVYTAVRRNARQFIENKIRFKDALSFDTAVYTDAKWLEFMLNQIITNAIKYSKSTDAEIEVSAEERHDSVCLTIRDNGIGISAADLDRVCDKGFTGENGRLGNKSTGIGLYLCKKLCQSLHHSIHIDSQKGVGTSVRIIFPKSSLNGS